jgi:hypothetical protein
MESIKTRRMPEGDAHDALSGSRDRLEDRRIADRATSADEAPTGEAPVSGTGPAPAALNSGRLQLHE